MATDNLLFYSGLSGIQLPIPKYRFPLAYQKSSRLTYYATFFNSIEINSSFYSIPQKSTVARWSASVPLNFRFTFKLFRDVTHTRDLNFKTSDVERFVNTVNETEKKKGCILVQLPPGLSSANIFQLDVLLKVLRANDRELSWDIAVEFRNKEWYQDAVYEILEHQKCAMVIHDKPGCATPANVNAADFIYIRLHGPTGNYRGSYTEPFLHDYAEVVKEWLSEGKRVYVYFNNTAGDAFANLQTFNGLL